MALSDKRILEEMRAGDIVITPFKKEQLATSSYDITLGEWYFREQRQEGVGVYNIWDKAHTDKVWGTKPLRADTAKKVFSTLGYTLKGVAQDDKIILLHPGETILCHTNEFIGGKNHITTMMKARSSLGRNFIEVCKCAGWGDVGYVNRWTMEVTNNSQHYIIPLVVGRRIGQIVFFETGNILDRDYTGAGKYAASTDVAKLKKVWKPDMMIPKLYLDREAQKS